MFCYLSHGNDFSCSRVLHRFYGVAVSVPAKLYAQANHQGYISGQVMQLSVEAKLYTCGRLCARCTQPVALIHTRVAVGVTPVRTLVILIFLIVMKIFHAAQARYHPEVRQFLKVVEVKSGIDFGNFNDCPEIVAVNGGRHRHTQHTFEHLLAAEGEAR